MSNEATSERELRRELCRLLESAHRNGVPVGTVSTWTCRHEHVPDREVTITELAKR